MDSVAEYDSSPERVPRRPPPPDELAGQSVPRKRRRVVELPAIVPIKRSEESFLVHVRLPIQHPQLKAFVNNLVGLARLGLVGGDVKAAFAELSDLHVSVARPGKVRAEQIGVLVSDLSKELACCEKLKVFLRKRVTAFAASSGRRVFVAAPLTTESASVVVQKVINAVDKVFKRHGLPVFFEEPKPHMSFASTETLDILGKYPAGEAVLNEDLLEILVDKVVCSVGKSYYYFTLR